MISDAKEPLTKTITYPNSSQLGRDTSRHLRWDVNEESSDVESLNWDKQLLADEDSSGDLASSPFLSNLVDWDLQQFRYDLYMETPIQIWREPMKLEHCQTCAVTSTNVLSHTGKQYTS